MHIPCTYLWLFFLCAACGGGSQTDGGAGAASGVAYEPIEMMDVSRRLQLAGQCTISHSTKEYHFCGLPGDKLVAITTEYVNYASTASKVDVSFSVRCKSHSLPKEQVHSDMAAMLEGLRAVAVKTMTENATFPESPNLPHRLHVTVVEMPDLESYAAIRSSLDGAGRDWVEEERRREQAIQERVSAAYHQRKVAADALEVAGPGARRAEAGVLAAREFAEELAPKLLALQEEFIGATEEEKATGMASLEATAGDLPLIEGSVQRWSEAAQSSKDLAAVWVDKSTASFNSKPVTENALARELSKEAARGRKLRATQVMEETQGRVAEAKAELDAKPPEAEAMVRRSRDALAGLDAALEEAAPKLREAVLPAQEKATVAVAAAESVGTKWSDLLIAAEAAKGKADALCEEANRVAARHEAGDLTWPAFADYDNLQGLVVPALEASSAALAVAEEAERSAQEAKADAFRAQTEALSRATQVGQALVRRASKARAKAGEMRLGVQRLASATAEAADQEEVAAQHIDTVGLFEEGCIELLMLTLEYADLHEGARSLDAAVKSKPRMAEIGKGLVRVRTLLVESPLPVSEKGALFLLPPHHDYFVVGKKQVRVDYHGSPTALGKAFDSVADRMLLSNRNLWQYLPDGSGKVDPGGKISAVLQETAPGPCLGIQLVSTD